MTAMDEGRIDHLRATYRDGLLEDVVPFWLRHAIDRECGGFLCSLDRDGSIIDTDKGVWQHGRFVWLMATLYNTVERREEWLETARHGLEFLFANGFDTDGRMFFHLTREGAPIRKRRYVFSECFACIAAAAYAKATGEARWEAEARKLFDLIWRHYEDPSLFAPKFTETRPMKGIGMPMILINVMQELRENLGGDEWDGKIDRCIEEIERDFVKPELECVLESVSVAGEFVDHYDGRTLNPGHAIECSWFILHEARHRGNDARLIGLGTRMLDWMWKRGWDEEYGGIIYFRDVKGLPVMEYWHDMKFFWPQNEAVIATLLAWKLTGETRYAKWHGMIHDYAHGLMPDSEYGEWFGYFHRDGRLSVPVKGNLWKGPFHTPRMQWYCWKLLEG